VSGFEVRSNLFLTLRERGKIVARRKGHNIWLNVGRQYLARLISYATFAPLAPEQDNRLSYIGFGIGGSRQNAPAVADNDPLLTHYPGTNNNSDLDATVSSLERPIRYAWVGTPSNVYDPDDVWLKQVQVPTHPFTTSTKYNLTVTTVEMTDGPYLIMPLSEIGLFHRGADLNSPIESPVAYDTFDTLPKTNALELSVSWTIRF
jgi:hypothetical protein